MTHMLGEMGQNRLPSASNPGIPGSASLLAAARAEANTASSLPFDVTATVFRRQVVQATGKLCRLPCSLSGRSSLSLRSQHLSAASKPLPVAVGQRPSGQTSVLSPLCLQTIHTAAMRSFHPICYRRTRRSQSFCSAVCRRAKSHHTKSWETPCSKHVAPVAVQEGADTGSAGPAAWG